VVFTTIRIALVHRGRLGSHFVAFSVIVDIAERMITIWSFSPPVSGATRALPQGANGDGRLHPHRTARAGFEPRYVLLAVGSAAAGWLVLFVYAVWRSGGAAAAFTHSYIHCVTTYKFLLGTELDKVLAILAVTATLSLSLSLSLSLAGSQASYQLGRRGAAAGDLSRFFAPEVAEQDAVWRSRICLTSVTIRHARTNLPT